MALITNTFESGPAGADVTIANSASPDPIAADPITIAASVQFSNEQAQKGTKSLRLAYNNTVGTAGIRFFQATPSNSASVRFYFRFATLPALSGLCLFTLHTTSLTDRRAYVTVTNNGAMSVYDFAGAPNFTAPNGSISTETWYRLEFGITTVTGSAGTSSLKVFLGDSTTAIPALTSAVTAQNYGGTALSNLQIGRFNSDSAPANGSPTVYYDDLAWNLGSAALLGPSTGTASSGDVHVHIG